MIPAVPVSALDREMAVRIHRNVILLQLASAAERSELQALIGLDEFIVAELSSLELLIEPQRLKELVSRMEERNIRPLMSRDGT